MDKTQEEKFEEYLCKHGSDSNTILGFRREAWESCLEANGIVEDFEAHFKENFPKLYEHLKSAIPDGYFKIGEEVEVKRRAGKYYDKAKVVVFIPGGGCLESTFDSDVRRIPAWKPKDSEAVFYMNEDGETAIGKIERNGQTLRTITGSRYDASRLKLKPFDASKIGKPWSEI